MRSLLVKFAGDQTNTNQIQSAMRSVYTRAGLIPVILLIFGIAGMQVTDNNQHEEEFIMSVTEQNKEIVRNLYENALNKRNFEFLQGVISDDFTGSDGKRGAEAFEERIIPLIEAFPDVQWKVQEIIGESGKVMIRWKLEGTHTGKPFMNIAPTGSSVLNDGIGIYELKNGKIVNARVQTDRLGFLQQLGVIPADFISSFDTNARKEQVIFIDRFSVPEKAAEEFITQMNDNRNFIKNLPGFVRDHVYERTDEDGYRIIVTVAVWENEDMLTHAREAVQTEYQRTGFNPQEFMERLDIRMMERGIYRELMGEGG